MGQRTEGNEMNKYIAAVDKIIQQVEDHIDRLSDSDKDISEEKVSALEAFRDTLQEAIDNLEGEWPQS